MERLRAACPGHCGAGILPAASWRTAFRWSRLRLEFHSILLREGCGGGIGETVRLRTRVSNDNGTTTGSVRTLVIVAVN